MRLYGENDMVKVGCHDCAGCFACCQGMGDTILLDPLDIYRLTAALKKGFEELLADCVELSVKEGLILPHIKMAGKEERCVFLNREGRCSIHAFRPGLCRAFPLGRNYEEGRLAYFLLEEECPAKNKTKQKVEKWLDTPQPEKNREFLVSWHYLVKRLKEKIEALYVSGGEEAQQTVKIWNLQFLHIFFLRAYNEDVDFYSQYEEKRKEMEALFEGN